MHSLPTIAFAAFVAAPPLVAQAPSIRKDPPQERAPASPVKPVLALGDAGMARAALARTKPKAAAAILLGVEWLVAHQNKDGRWDSDGFVAHDGDSPSGGPGNPTQDVAVTGLAVLALAREGRAPADDPRREPLLRAVHWLVEQQEDNGRLGPATVHDFVYGHAIGAFALCAAVAATDSDEARGAAQNALAHLEAHRNPFGVWRYQPRDNDNDSSVTTWATMALLAGAEVGIAPPARALQQVATWFDLVTDEGGRAGYTKRGEASSRQVRTAGQFPPDRGEAMTAAALWCRSALGQNATGNPVIAAGAKLLLGKPPRWDPASGDVDYCYWLFGTEAMRRLGGADRDAWNDELLAAILPGQRTDATAAGSWDPVDPWGGDGGRLYSTALAVMALQGLYALNDTSKADAEPR
ncbi:MAG: hypothetical protein JNK78_10240 [Planctomycetes bacterium]|nr:hypothetical protein [Planctomycetota bacterium]